MPSLQPHHLTDALPRFARQQRRHRRAIYTRHIDCFRLPSGSQFIEPDAQRRVPRQTMPACVARHVRGRGGAASQAIGYLQFL